MSGARIKFDSQSGKDQRNDLTLCKVYQVPPSAKAKGHDGEKGRREGAYNTYSFIAP